MRILVSGCLSGLPCGTDGTSYGDHAQIRRLLSLPNVKPVPFCPEEVAFGTPRETPDIHGGNGFDVLDGKARVITDKGRDWTEPLIQAAYKMLVVAVDNRVDLAILMDISGSCGTQVIYDGPRHLKVHQKGPGVCAALLIRSGYRVISNRDFRALEWLTKKLVPMHEVDSSAMDHHETAWYLSYFCSKPGPRPSPSTPGPAPAP